MAYGKIYKSQTGKQTDGQEDTDRRKQTDRQTDRQTETDRRIQTDRQNFPNILKMNEDVSQAVLIFQNPKYAIRVKIDVR